MGTKVRCSISAFITQILFTMFVILQLSNLVICGDPDDDSLQNALEYVERRERDLQLQDNDYYGQPEDIGYGYQKNFGIFENVPVRELGSQDYDRERENDFRNIVYAYANQRDDYGGTFSKRKTHSRVSPMQVDLLNQKDNGGNQRIGNDIQCSYTRTVKDLWCRYLQSQQDDVGLEDISPDQVADILDTLQDKDDSDSYENSMYSNGPASYDDTIPLRSRRNYRIFDRLNEKRRYPSFGEGFYGKRSPHSQRINYESPSESEFLYALKFVNPDLNRDAVENLRDGGYDVLGEEKDRDVFRMLSDALRDNPRPVDQDDSYWAKTEEQDDGEWLQGPVVPSDDISYQDVYDKRTAPKIFKQHNGIHLNNKRAPVKRSPVRSKKEAVADEKVSKEVKGIFEGHSSTAAPPKKEPTKKPTEVIKKMNVTKPEVTKHRDVKKLVRRANDYTKEQIYPNSEIEKIFSAPKVDKKSIDWSQYFGYDKRSESWLRDDSIRRAENLFLTPSKRNFAHYAFNEKDSLRDAPFDTRIFNSKNKLSYNVNKNIDKMEEKLGNIEERIIDDAVKYTGAHTGTQNDDLRKVKSEIVHRLEAAYSLEKMKNALEEFKNSMKSEKSFPGEEATTGSKAQKTDVLATTVRPEKTKPDAEKSKRLSTKKEIDDVYGKDDTEFLNWPSPKESGFSSNYQYDNGAEECPVVDKSVSNCLKVSGISGRFSELLLPICSLQQVCYTCGTEIGVSRPSVCELMYLREAENLCQGNKACLQSARDSMLAIRDLHEEEMLVDGDGRRSDSCMSNSCIQNYFMNTPVAMVLMDLQD